MTRKTNKQHNQGNIPIHKIIVFGRGGLGKTTLIKRFVYSVVVDDIEIEDSWRKQCVIDGKGTILDITEVFTQGEFSAFRDFCIRDSEGIMFVYSIASRKSFNEISGLYQDVLRVRGNLPFCAIIVATKSDLRQERQVSTEEGRELAERLHCQFIEMSSKEGINVDESFYTIAREIQSNKEAQSKNDEPADKSGVSGCRCLIL